MLKNNNFTRYNFLLFLIVTLALLQSSCGFQLRGAIPTLGPAYNPIFIAGLSQSHPIHRELKKQLTRSGASVTADSSNAKSIISITGYRQDERVLSVDNRNKAVEYELEEKLDFEVRNAQNDILIKKQHLRILRISLQAIAIVSRKNEEADLRKDMRTDLTRRIITQLAAQLK